MNIDFEPVERNTVSDEIIKQVISQINTGKLAPGSKLPSERELMEKFHVSRSSVREALHSLAMIGLLETFPGAGTFVSKELVNIIGGQLDWSVLLGNQDLLELMEVREPLEIQAAGLAAQRATPEGILQVRQAIENYTATLTDGDSHLEAELSFHMAVARVSGNPTLIRIIQIFQDLLRDYHKNRRLGFATSPASIEEYQNILNALEQGDVDGAREAMCLHLSRSKLEALVEQMNDLSEQNRTKGEGDQAA